MNSQPPLEPLISPSPELFCSDRNASLVFGGDYTLYDPDSMVQDGSTDFKLDLSSSFGTPSVAFQRSWPRSDLWKGELRGREEVNVSVWGGRAGAVGGVVQRDKDDWTQRPQTRLDRPYKLDSMLSNSSILPQSADRYTSMYTTVQYPDIHNVTSRLSPPTEVVLWDHSHSSDLTSRGGTATVSASYGSKCWKGRERKRSGEAAGVFGAGKLK